MCDYCQLVFKPIFQDAMNHLSRYALILLPLVLVACSKKVETAPAQAVVVPVEAPAPATVTAAPAAAAVDPANMTDEQRATAKRQDALDFATTEDKHMNDPLAQWATAATASSSATRSDGTVYENYVAAHMIGPVDGEYWENKNHDIGFEWVQLEYAKPVNATEVRLVVDNGTGVEALNKVELQSTDGTWNTIWTGLSEVEPDRRGPRTWYVKKFPKTAYKVKAVKYTIANNVKTGTKNFDAAQLVGE